MIQPGSYAVVHMVRPQEVGSYFDRARWPLHITLLPWFGAGAPHAVVRRELSRLSQDTAPFDVIVGEQAMFGTNKDVPVRLLTDQTPVLSLHHTLLESLRLSQLTLADEEVMWAGDKFIAHITEQPNGVLVNAGDRLRMDDWYLVTLQDPRRCQILARFELRGQSASHEGANG
jgi:hypothetical protein